ncbi:MAG: tetratricopeptide repeat protein [Alphaproteobacteria bacterium]|nr:tetratricopeptide repeat protein [Alphaproteobacteria bacterium]
MLFFLISVLLLTIGSLCLFIFPIVPLKPQTKLGIYAKRGYIVFVFILFAIIVPTGYTCNKNAFLPDCPLKSRDKIIMEKDPHLMAELRRYEYYLEKTPDDSYIWSQIGQLYRDAKLFDQAASAYRNAIKWGIPADITNWHALAQTTIQASNGKITGEAQKAFENVLRYRPDDATALYFIGLARLQNNEPRKALAIWRYLEQILSIHDPWLELIQERIKELSLALKMDPALITPATTIY